MIPSPTNPHHGEFDRQVQTLLDLGYPGLDDPLALDDLRDELDQHLTAGSDPAPTPTSASFVLVPARSAMPVSERIGLVGLGGRPGTLNRHFADADSFAPVLDVPEVAVYALVDVQRGEEFCGVRPAEAGSVLASRDRTPLTIEEGIAFLHASPASLEKNRCFHTSASRGGDKRVPALWITDRAPTLGWCWENNHHTWLGVASTGARVAGVPVGNRTLLPG